MRQRTSGFPSSERPCESRLTREGPSPTSWSKTGSGVRLYKAATTPRDPADGILDGGRARGRRRQRSELEDFLARGRGLHPRHDAGDQRDPDGHDRAHGAAHHARAPRHAAAARGRAHRAVRLEHGYPDPYIPRALTFEVAERIGSQGEVVQPLDERCGRRR